VIVCVAQDPVPFNPAPTRGLELNKPSYRYALDLSAAANPQAGARSVFQDKMIVSLGEAWIG
jgi:hypothetical protein